MCCYKIKTKNGFLCNTNKNKDQDHPSIYNLNDSYTILFQEFKIIVVLKKIKSGLLSSTKKTLVLGILYKMNTEEPSALFLSVQKGFDKGTKCAPRIFTHTGTYKNQKFWRPPSLEKGTSITFLPVNRCIVTMKTKLFFFKFFL